MVNGKGLMVNENKSPSNGGGKGVGFLFRQFLLKRNTQIFLCLRRPLFLEKGGKSFAKIQTQRFFPCETFGSQIPHATEYDRI